MTTPRVTVTHTGAPSPAPPEPVGKVDIEALLEACERIEKRWEKEDRKDAA
jgi:hypothetical protein